MLPGGVVVGGDQDARAAGPDVRSERVGLPAVLAPWDAGCAHLNFAERSAPPSAFFGADVLARLREVQQRYDAADLVRSNHPVR